MDFVHTLQTSLPAALVTVALNLVLAAVLVGLFGAAVTAAMRKARR